MIVLEGPDGSGKSTLAKQLENVLDRPLWHPGGAVDDELVFEWMKKCELKLEQGFILDRATHISEFVYGPLINGREPVTFEMMMSFLKKCVEKDWKIIYCRPKNVLALNHTRADHDDDAQISAVEKHHERIVSIYDGLFNTKASDYFKKKGVLFVYDYEKTCAFASLMDFLGVKEND